MTTQDYWKKRVLRENNLNHSINTIDKDLKRIYQKSYYRLERELKRLYLEIMESEGKVQLSHLYQYNRYYQIMTQLQEEMVRLGKTQQDIFEKELTDLYVYNQQLLDPAFDYAMNKAAVEEAIHIA